MSSSREIDVRMDVMNSLLNTPHRKVADVMPLHAKYASEDASFYAHLAAWYMKNGDIRDHKEVFIATLFQSPIESHREAAYAMLMDLPVHQVARTMGHMRTFFKKVPRIARTAVKDLLKAYEMNESRFDQIAVRSRNPMKQLYATFHVKRGERAGAILFDRVFPEGSLPYYVKMLCAKNLTEEDRARLIVEKSIPFVTAMDALPGVTPVTLAALIGAMTPQEVVNCMAQLKRRGAMDDEVMRKMIHEKIDRVSTDKRASGAKAAVAADVAALDAETRKKLEKATDDTIKAKGNIRRPSAIFIDRSGSLSVAIELGMRVASAVSGACVSDVWVYAFNNMATEIESPGKGATDWSKSFRGLQASGGTCIGSAFAALERHKRVAEEIVIITDEAENAQPYSGDAYISYCKATGTAPHITIVRVGNASDYCQKRLVAAGARVDTIDFKGDYYAITNLVTMMSRPSRLDLLMEIADEPLPSKKTASRRLAWISGKDRNGDDGVNEEGGEEKCSTSGIKTRRTTSRKSSSPKGRRPKK